MHTELRSRLLRAVALGQPTLVAALEVMLSWASVGLAEECSLLKPGGWLVRRLEWPWCIVELPQSAAVDAVVVAAVVAYVAGTFLLVEDSPLRKPPCYPWALRLARRLHTYR